MKKENLSNLVNEFLDCFDEIEYRGVKILTWYDYNNLNDHDAKNIIYFLEQKTFDALNAERDYYKKDTIKKLELFKNKYLNNSELFN